MSTFYVLEDISLRVSPIFEFRLAPIYMLINL